MKRSELIAAAKELNDVLGLEPAIDVKGKVPHLQKGITKAMDLINPAEDEFTPETQAVLETLGMVMPGDAETKQESEKEPEPTKQEPEKQEPEPTKPEPEKKVAKSKTKAKPEKETKHKAKSGKKEEKPKPVAAKKEKTAKAPKKTRGDIMADILRDTKKTPMTKKQMIDEMQQRYSGSANEAAFNVYLFTRLLESLGLTKQDNEGKVTYIGT